MCDVTDQHKMSYKAGWWHCQPDRQPSFVGRCKPDNHLLSARKRFLFFILILAVNTISLSQHHLKIISKWCCLSETIFFISEFDTFHCSEARLFGLNFLQKLRLQIAIGHSTMIAKVNSSITFNFWITIIMLFLSQK